MDIIKTDIEGVLIIEPKIYGDHRGWFTETYSKEKYRELGISIDFLQDNHSFSAQKGTLRGLHFQLNPKEQTKLVRCTKGEILDVAVDIRKGSTTYKKWIAVELSEENKKQLLVPKGFAHGFITLTNDVEVQYKVDEYYSPENDRSIRFDDPEIGIDWGTDKPIISEKDLKAPFLKDSDANFSIKILVTGAKGQLGYDVVKQLKDLKLNVVGTDSHDMDITKKDAVEAKILKEKPDIIIHCAAYTEVDKAEDEKDLCYAVNVEGTRNIAEAVKKINATMVYISTDYVFDGKGEKPHIEEKEISPINYYGFSKAQGELVVRKLVEKYFIVRISWAFGKNGNNFVKTMLKLAETMNEINVVNDQLGSPTYTKDLALLISRMIQTKHYGIYHATNEGYTSWYEFAKQIFEESGINMKVNPIASSEYPTKAKRPINSRLEKVNIDKLGLDRLPEWQDAVKRYLVEQNNIE